MADFVADPNIEDDGDNDDDEEIEVKECDLDFDEIEKRHLSSEPKKWKELVNIYRENKKWEDAVRIVREYDTEKEIFNKVAFSYVCSMTNDDDAYEFMLSEHMYEEAVDYAVDSEDFDKALQMAKDHGLDDMIDDITIAIAQKAEDDEDFPTAEEIYLSVKRYQDAYDMYQNAEKKQDMARLLESYPDEIEK